MSWRGRLWRRRKMEQQLEKELRFHIEEHAADLVARGVPPAEARRQARLALGGQEQVKELCRDARGTRWFEDLLQDARFWLHVLQAVLFTALAVLAFSRLAKVTASSRAAAGNRLLSDPIPG